MWNCALVEVSRLDGVERSYSHVTGFSRRFALKFQAVQSARALETTFASESIRSVHLYRF